jgi:hypothetical protein
MVYSVNIFYDEGLDTRAFFEDVNQRLVEEVGSFGGAIAHIGEWRKSYVFGDGTKEKVQGVFEEACFDRGLDVKFDGLEIRIR